MFLFGLLREVCAEPDNFVPPSSEPMHLTVLGQNVVFSADDGKSGRELWISDGKPGGARLLMDLLPGKDSGNPTEFFLAGDRLLFRAKMPKSFEFEHEGRGIEPWITDGTNSGTFSLLDIHPGVSNSNPHWIGSTNGLTFFSAVTANFGNELWKTDGTIEGTQLAIDLNRGPANSLAASPSGTICGDNSFLLCAHIADKGLCFVVTDGTQDGVILLQDVAGGSDVLGTCKGKSYFLHKTPEFGWELWSTDGRPEGTSLVRDVHAGTADGAPKFFLCMGDFFLFQATDATHGAELWRSDGTADGTMLIKDIDPGLNSSAPGFFMRSGTLAFFVARNSQHGREIWRTDGTSEGTIMLADANHGAQDGEPYALASAGNGHLFFSARSQTHGEELWHSDGTAEGTRMVKDINPGPSGSEPYSTVVLNDAAIFTAGTAEHGRELWRSDGTEAGTYLLDDILSTHTFNPSSHPHSITVCGDKLFYVANDFKHGFELWCMDADGTQPPRLLRDIFVGPASSDPHELLADEAKGIVYFVADDGILGNELWRSDGTTEGTVLLNDYVTGPLSGSPRELVLFRDTVYFSAWSPQTGDELCRLDVNASFSVILDIVDGPGSSHPKELVVAGELLYFRANDGIHGEELWVTNGTSSQTRMVYDIVPISNVGANPHSLTTVGEGLVFVCDDGWRGAELWFSTADSPPQLLFDTADEAPWDQPRAERSDDDKSSGGAE